MRFTCSKFAKDPLVYFSGMLAHAFELAIKSATFCGQMGAWDGKKNAEFLESNFSFPETEAIN